MDRLSDTSASFLTLLLWIIRRLCVTSGMCEHACVTLSTSGADIDGRRASAAADSRQPYIQTDYLNNPRLPEPSGPALCSVLITPAPLYLPPPSGGRKPHLLQFNGSVFDLTLISSRGDEGTTTSSWR